jgi:hypothetical protein
MPLDSLEKDNSLRWLGGHALPAILPSQKDRATNPQDDGEDVESLGERYVIHRARSRSIRRKARPKRLVTSSSLI